MVLAVASPVGCDVAGVAHGDEVVVGGPPQLIHDFGRRGLLALDAERVTEFTSVTGWVSDIWRTMDSA